MTRSLQRHLSLTLGGAILLAALVAALASFVLAYAEAKEFQDDMLRQIAVLNGKASMESVPAQGAEGAGDTPIADPESRILILHLPKTRQPEWLSDDLPPGFHTLNARGEQLRVFIHAAGAGRRTVVAQPTDARDEIAINSALRTLIPLLLLLPVLAWLIVRIVRREFAPIARLSRSLDEQAADRPRPIADDSLPDEIAPFVQAINRLLERVNQLMVQQRRFIADAAHELRSPLTALSVQAQNLRQAVSLEVMQSRVVPLQEGIERARQLTEQLLSMARTQAGTPAESVVDVSGLARELLADYLPMAEAKGIDLGLEENARFSLSASTESLRLILGNAVSNALKYSPAGTEVTIRLLTEDEIAVVEVVDNGPGIAAAERERVFDAFYRLPGTAGTGSGLGLSIAREAAFRLGGNVSLSERRDRPGLVFRYRQRRHE
ncbi:MAG: two-component sensor histidine kinase [Burkholderiales bacterium]|nr:two-component sensor histidine kinase [Burkholderiales bacterium]